ncbi:archaeosortase/exosortase family protein [Chloroflexota bacterium]
MKIRLIVWLTACMVFSVLFFGELWTKLPQWLSPVGLQSHGIEGWGILGLCTLSLWLKRKDILPGMQVARPDPLSIIAGVALLALSIFLPSSDTFLIFLMLLGWLGVFVIIFNRACLIPSMLLAIYGFSLVLPTLIIRGLGEPAAMATANILTAITRMVGLPVTSVGLVLHITTLTGDVISVTVGPTCIGYRAISLFIALFSVMMLDIRLPLSKAWYMFLLGLLGTWLQNITRLIVIVAAGYYWGAGALEATHQNISYFIFPVWYALFVYIYLRQAKRKKTSI